MAQMIRGLRAGLAGIFSLAAALSATGFAQAQTAAECACLLSQATLPATGPIGQVIDVSGNNITLVGQPGPVEPGAPLQLGDQLIIGAQSSASFAVGNCSLQLSAGTEMTLAPANGNLCVAVHDAATPGFGDAGMLALGGLAAAGIVGIIVSLGDDDPVSP